MSQPVDEYIQGLKQPWQAEICQQIHQIIHQANPDITERIQYGKPHYLRDGKYAYVLGTAKGWVSFTIFSAPSLEAPDGFFEPSDTTERKTVKIHQGQDFDYTLLARLVQQTASSS